MNPKPGDATSTAPTLPGTAEELLPLVYEELRRIAAQRMTRERPEHRLQATALVHEAWIRLHGDGDGQWNDRSRISPRPRSQCGHCFDGDTLAASHRPHDRLTTRVSRLFAQGAVELRTGQRPWQRVESGLFAKSGSSCWSLPDTSSARILTIQLSGADFGYVPGPGNPRGLTVPAGSRRRWGRRH